MKAIVLLAFLCAALIPSATAAPADRPNVILILSDDQGAVDAGCYGAKDLATPHLDALAARGVRFTQFYAAAPVCSPSRASALTGRYPLRAGLTGNATSQPGGKGGLPAAQVTVAEFLKEAGYATAHIGKWHLGYSPDTVPQAQGFDHSFGHMGGCIDNYSHFFYWDGPNRHDLFRNGVAVHQPGRFFGDLMVEEAGEFMTRHRDRPFFIYFALNMPHYPYQGDPKWLERFRDLPPARRLYAAFLATMDERLGALLARVDGLGLRERTLVIFQSDNGHSTEVRAHGGGGSAGVYRGAKFSLFEGGIRLPAVVSWPGRLPQGVVRDQVAHASDWFPTIAELAGVSVRGRDLDGRSLVPVLQSAKAPSPHEALFWHGGGGSGAQWAVRQGDWKLLGNAQDTGGGTLAPADKKLFLSNLRVDVTESTNHAAAHPAVVERLRRAHEDWFKAHRREAADAGDRDAAGNEK
jgi:arylsulfatase A-like enzyme